jgi:hypothetical protein
VRRALSDDRGHDVNGDVRVEGQHADDGHHRVVGVLTRGCEVVGLDTEVDPGQALVVVRDESGTAHRLIGLGQPREFEAVAGEQRVPGLKPLVNGHRADDAVRPGDAQDEHHLVGSR